MTSPVYFYLLLRHTADAIMYWTHDVTRSADVTRLFLATASYLFLPR